MNEQEQTERYLKLDKELGQLQKEIWSDKRIPFEVAKDIDRRLSEMRGIPF